MCIKNYISYHIVLYGMSWVVKPSIFRTTLTTWTSELHCLISTILVHLKGRSMVLIILGRDFQHGPMQCLGLKLIYLVRFSFFLLFFHVLKIRLLNPLRKYGILILHVTFFFRYIWCIYIEIVSFHFFAGLFISGQDICSCGFSGALWGGFLCASAALERNVFNDLVDVHKRGKALKKSD